MLYDKISWISSWASILGFVISVFTIILVGSISKAIQEKNIDSRLKVLISSLRELRQKPQPSSAYSAKERAYKNLVKEAYPPYRRHSLTKYGRARKEIYEASIASDVNFELLEELYLNLKVLEDNK